MKKCGLLPWLLVLALCLLAGCGKSENNATGADPKAEALSAYIMENLPESYVKSERLSLEISGQKEPYAVKLTLDMAADGSDYSNFSGEDMLLLSELESSYLLEECLKEPPSLADFTLLVWFSEETQVTVTKVAADSFYTRSYQGESVQF